MFEYKSDQRIVEIGGVRVGGIPGTRPPVLVGSVFYMGDPLVSDAQTGAIDRSEADTALRLISELSEKTKLPSMLDVVATSPEAMRKYLTYLVDETPFPLLIDGSASVEVNLAGIEVAEAGGFLDRVALNSLTPNTSPAVYEVAQEKGLRNAVILTFSMAAVTSVKERVDIASQIVDKAGAVGISNVLIDTAVIDAPTLGIACSAQHVIKDRLGFPVGCGAHNAVSTWKGFTKRFGKPARISGIVASVTMPVAMGADFVLYGPVQHASEVYPAIHLVDKALSGLQLVTDP